MALRLNLHVTAAVVPLCNNLDLDRVYQHRNMCLWSMYFSLRPFLRSGHICDSSWSANSFAIISSEIAVAFGSALATTQCEVESL